MCTSPLYRFPVPFVEKRHEHGHGYKNGGFIASSPEALQDVMEYYNQRYHVDFSNLQEIPCGQCLECRINYSKQWAQRCLAEAQTSGQECYFITLTYDDDHLLDNVKYTISRQTGELGLFPCLNKSDMTKYLKDFREHMRTYYNTTGIRFLYCGEYGSQNGRPHYHLLQFNCTLPDLKHSSTVDMNGRSYSYWSSSLLEKVWKKGFVTVAELNWETCAYTCRYVLKKFKGLLKTDYLMACKTQGVEPQPEEFINMSRKPGIGREFYELHKDSIYKYDEVILPGGNHPTPCSYYDKLYDIEQPSLLEVIKDNRHKQALMSKLSNTIGMNYEQLAEFDQRQAEAFERSINQLSRTL